MQIIQTLDALQQCIASHRQHSTTIALVPTMGNLHEGHLTLVRQAKCHADVVIVSIYVNPLQFAPNEDFASYPRTLTEDCQQLEQCQADILYLPDTASLYPDGEHQHTQVSVPALDGRHCGASRPHFFTGVATIVTKLFNLIRPDVALFGEKDFQQLAIIKKLVHDLCLPVRIISVPIQRAANGLALSSRNRYLSAEQHEQAALLYQGLCQAKAWVLEKRLSLPQIEERTLQHWEQVGFQPDYCSICHRASLQPATAQDRSLVILTAAYLGSTRLIDNITLDR